MDLVWLVAGLTFLIMVLLYGVTWIILRRSPNKNHPEETEHPVEQINNIEIEAMEEMDRISDYFLNEVFEYINQGEFKNG